MQCACSAHAVFMQCSIYPHARAVSMHCPVCACTSAFSTSPMASSRAAVCWKAIPITSTSTSLGVLPMAASWACSPYNRSNAVSFLHGFFHHQLRSSRILGSPGGSGETRHHGWGKAHLFRLQRGSGETRHLAKPTIAGPMPRDPYDSTNLWEFFNIVVL